ncbi:MAG: sodium-dependent transporter [Phycisphaeraceae bacterium]
MAEPERPEHSPAAGGEQRDVWATRFGVILAVTGSAVGLGNFLRFPSQAAQYGDGDFMIPYIVAFLLLGLPIAWVEWSIGRYGGRNGYSSLAGMFFSFRKGRWLPYLGVLGVVLPLMIYTFYIYVVGWCLAYAWFYLTGTMEAGAAEQGGYAAFWQQFVGIHEDGYALLHARPSQSPLLFVLIAFVLNFILIYRGVSKGIEWFCRWAMPLLVVIAAIMVVRVLTLSPPADAPDRTVLAGLGAMWNPSAEALLNPEIWLAAAGQVFFSLSVGFGVIATYASYMKPDDDVALSSTTAAAGNGFAEVALAGMMIIPAAFIFLGPGIFDDPPGTFGMGFIALPEIFAAMPAGRWFGFLFFFLLFMAAMTSTISLLQPAIAFLEEGLGIGRKASVSLLGFITLIGACFVMYFSAELKAMDTIDFWMSTVGLFVLGTVLVIIFGWVLGIDRGMSELTRGAEIPVPGLVRYLIKYVTPVFLLVVMCAWLWDKAWPRISAIWQDGVVGLSFGLIVVAVVLFVLLIANAAKRWRQRERELTEVSP